jgi:hypothetical protein
MQKTKMHITILAIMLAGQSYAAAGVAAADRHDPHKRARSTVGSSTLSDIVANKDIGRRLEGFLDTRSIMALSVANKETQEALLKSSLPLAIARTDLTATPIDLRKIKAVLKREDALYIEALEQSVMQLGSALREPIGEVSGRLKRTFRNYSRVSRWDVLDQTISALRQPTKTVGAPGKLRDVLNRTLTGHSKLSRWDVLGNVISSIRRSVEDGSIVATQYLNTAAANCSFIFDADSGLEYLKVCIRERDQHAQEQLIWGINWSTLVCDPAYLRELSARPDDEMARSVLIAMVGRGFLDVDVAGRNYLEKCSTDYGDVEAQGILNEAAYDGKGLFGFDDHSGLAYLNDRIRVGDPHAQKEFCHAAARGQLGFTDETGPEYLLDRIRVGDNHAQEELNYAAAHGQLGFTDATGYEYLLDRIRVGDNHAQEELNDAAAHGQLGFTDATGYAYLLKRVGDEHAHKLLNHAAHYKRLGFTAEKGLAYIRKRIRLGDVEFGDYLGNYPILQAIVDLQRHYRSM